MQLNVMLLVFFERLYWDDSPFSHFRPIAVPVLLCRRNHCLPLPRL